MKHFVVDLGVSWGLKVLRCLKCGERFDVRVDHNIEKTIHFSYTLMEAISMFFWLGALYLKGFFSYLRCRYGIKLSKDIADLSLLFPDACVKRSYLHCYHPQQLDIPPVYH